MFLKFVPRGVKVLEVGCAEGDLLAALKPSYGLGIDISGNMIAAARRKYPGLSFEREDAHVFSRQEKFDYIILSDVVNDLWDVEVVLKIMGRLLDKGGRIVLNFNSRLWQLPLDLARKSGFARPLCPQNWLTVADVKNLLMLSDMEMIRSSPEMICPFKIPIVGRFLNKYVGKVWPFRHLSITNFIVARRIHEEMRVNNPKVSVVVPARNEEGNIENIIKTMPDMGGGTELIFVEGHSKDNTYRAIKESIAKYPDKNCCLYSQIGMGKGDAVRLGFEKASGDVLMIYDADMTVPIDSLPKFYVALVKGKAEFVNGVRLVYPMENKAMRFLNVIGNKFFSWAFTWLLEQPIKDTLCGTKVLWKNDYLKIAANRAYFGEFDPFGDFDLLFGAARLNLKIIDLPVRYKERVYGDTNINRWRHGWLLLRMSFMRRGS